MLTSACSWYTCRPTACICRLMCASWSASCMVTRQLSTYMSRSSALPQQYHIHMTENSLLRQDQRHTRSWAAYISTGTCVTKAGMQVPTKDSVCAATSSQSNCLGVCSGIAHMKQAITPIQCTQLGTHTCLKETGK